MDVSYDWLAALVTVASAIFIVIAGKFLLILLFIVTLEPRSIGGILHDAHRVDMHKGNCATITLLYDWLFRALEKPVAQGIPAKAA